MTEKMCFTDSIGGIPCTNLLPKYIFFNYIYICRKQYCVMELKYVVGKKTKMPLVTKTAVLSTTLVRPFLITLAYISAIWVAVCHVNTWVVGLDIQLIGSETSPRVVLPC